MAQKQKLEQAKLKWCFALFSLVACVCVCKFEMSTAAASWSSTRRCHFETVRQFQQLCAQLWVTLCRRCRSMAVWRQSFQKHEWKVKCETWDLIPSSLQVSHRRFGETGEAPKKIAQNYPKLPKIAQNCSKLLKTPQKNYPKMPKNTQKYPKLAQFCSNPA